MRIKKRRAVLLFVVVAAFVAFGYMLATGGMPLQDGVKLAGGKITVAVDKFMAAYVVELDDGGLLLIDATMDPRAEAIHRAIDAIGKSSDGVAAILLTHGHGDHIAGALAFREAEIYVLEADADLVEGTRVAQSLFGRFREPEATGITVTHRLADGDVVDIGNTRIRVFAVPGHTLGSAAYLVHGVLFLGDSAAARSDGGITGAPPVFSADRAMNRRSLHQLIEKLDGAAADVETLAFGHQGHIDGLSALRMWADENPR